MSFVVAIDGPAAAGKSSVARAAASALGFLYVDTGAMYRAMGLKLRQEGVAPEDAAGLERCLAALRLELSGSPDAPRVLLDGVEVSAEIRTPEMSEMASRLAALPRVRRRLVELQRTLRERGPLVGEGRDLGTVVFPDAEVKIYLDADLDTRARRREREFRERGIAVTLARVREELAGRDERDRTRADSPLKAASDAIRIDSSGMDLRATVEAVLEVVRRHPALPDPAGRTRPGTAAGGRDPGGAPDD